MTTQYTRDDGIWYSITNGVKSPVKDESIVVNLEVNWRMNNQTPARVSPRQKQKSAMDTADTVIMALSEYSPQLQQFAIAGCSALGQPGLIPVAAALTAALSAYAANRPAPNVDVPVEPPQSTPHPAQQQPMPEQVHPQYQSAAEQPEAAKPDVQAILAAVESDEALLLSIIKHVKNNPALLSRILSA